MLLFFKRLFGRGSDHTPLLEEDGGHEEEGSETKEENSNERRQRDADPAPHQAVVAAHERDGPGPSGPGKTALKEASEYWRRRAEQNTRPERERVRTLRRRRGTFLVLFLLLAAILALGEETENPMGIIGVVCLMIHTLLEFSYGTLLFSANQEPSAVRPDLERSEPSSGSGATIAGVLRTLRAARGGDSAGGLLTSSLAQGSSLAGEGMGSTRQFSKKVRAPSAFHGALLAFGIFSANPVDRSLDDRLVLATWGCTLLYLVIAHLFLQVEWRKRRTDQESQSGGLAGGL